MSGTGKIEWYLARDGQQHGPLSQIELDKFIELGHLRPEDLLWRAGFDDWRPAAEVFPPRPPQPAAPTLPTLSAEDRQSEGAASGTPATDPADMVPDAGPASTVQPQAQEPQPRVGGTPSDWGEAAPADATITASASAVTQRPTSFEPTGPSLQPKKTLQPFEPRFDVAPNTASESGQPQTPASSEFDEFDEFDDEEPAARSGWLLVAAALFVAVMLGAAGLFAYNNQSMVSAFVDDLLGKKPNKEIAVIKAPSTAVKEPAEQAEPTKPASRTEVVVVRTPPAQPSATETQPLPEVPLLKSKVWQFAQQEFGEWADKRLQEVRRLSAASKTREETNQYLVESFVRFRRQNANIALSAAPENLAEIANAFVGSLRALTTKGPEPCYAYISNGESTPELANFFFDPEIGSKLEAQMLAIMKAIASGRDAAQSRQRRQPTEVEFNMLSKELEKRGWTAKDLGLFSDPGALSQAEPKLVCRLVTEWFAAQTQLSDQKTRDQLIAASLRPVIGG